MFREVKACRLGLRSNPAWMQMHRAWICSDSCCRITRLAALIRPTLLVEFVALFTWSEMLGDASASVLSHTFSSSRT